VVGEQLAVDPESPESRALLSPSPVSVALLSPDPASSKLLSLESGEEFKPSGASTVVPSIDVVESLPPCASSCPSPLSARPDTTSMSLASTDSYVGNKAGLMILGSHVPGVAPPLG
jgi:hypothetical protein